MSQTIYRLCGAPRLVEEQNTITVTDRTNTMEVRTMTDNRTELNRAIFNIITSEKPLKDMKEDVKAVRKAGYEIIKYDVRKWSVENRATCRHVRARVRYREINIDNSYRFCKTISTEGCNYRSEYFDRCKVDFVGILEKPLNDVWNEVCHRRRYAGTIYDHTSTKSKYQSLKEAISHLNWEKHYVEEDLKQIAELQKKLARDIEDRVKAEMRLKQLRKELGLTGRR